MGTDKKKGLMDRRSFLRGSAVVGALSFSGAVGLAGCAPNGTTDQAQSTTNDSVAASVPGPDFGAGVEPVAGEVKFVADEISDGDIVATEEFEVVVIGAGIAGAVAFASAAESGANVCLIEKTAMSAAHGTATAAIGAKVQQAAGVELDRDEIVGDAIKSSAYRCNPDLINTWADESALALDWLIDTILTPSGLETKIPWDGNYQAGWQKWFGDHVDLGTGTVNGVAAGMSEVVPAILDYGTKLNGEIRYSAPAVQLIREGDNTGRVNAVIAETEEGYVKYVASKGIVLATGGYENNYERIQRFYRPRDIAAVSAWMNPYNANTGDGHEMGLAVGAWEDEAPHCFLIAQSGIDNHTPFGALLSAPWVRVNSLGKRFTSERLSYNYLAQSIAMQPSAHAWCLISSDWPEAVDKYYAGGGPGADIPLEGMVAMLEGLDGMVEEGIAFRGETIEDLAQQIGIPADTLGETIERYNGFCKEGRDDDYLNTEEWLYPMNVGPYYALREGTAVMCTMNGLRTDTQGTVIDIEGRGIEGLYAVGNVAGGWFDGTYTHHINGISHGRCITFGHIAGHAAAKG